MTIIFDEEKRRSIHVESGLAVEWVREDYPLERRTYFKLIVGKAEFPFIGSYNKGEDKIEKLFPGIDPVELFKKLGELNEVNYNASNINSSFDRDVFVSVWNDLVMHTRGTRRVTTSYVEYIGRDPDNSKEWSMTNER